MTTQRIHDRYDPEHDASEVSWADETLAGEIDLLNAKCAAMLKEIEGAHRLIDRLFQNIDRMQRSNR